MGSVSINISIPLKGLSTERLDELLRLVAELELHTDVQNNRRICARAGCGQPITRSRTECDAQYERKRYCSRKCGAIAKHATQRAARVAALPLRVCEHCGKTLTIRPSEPLHKFKARRYCNRSCDMRHRHELRKQQAASNSTLQSPVESRESRQKRSGGRTIRSVDPADLQRAIERRQAEKRDDLPDPRPAHLREGYKPPGGVVVEAAVSWGTCERCGGKLGPDGCGDCQRRERWLAGQRKQAQRIKGAYEGGPR
jgi:hypothetical protein